MNKQKHYTVIIAGGGPVGLFLGLRLAQLGINFIIIEKRTETHSHSRSIGIHPPSLEMFDTLGLSQQLMSNGILIRKGLAFQDAGHLVGTLKFELSPKPHQYVLTLPQFQTEQILKKALLEKIPGCITYGEISDLKQNNEYIIIDYQKSSTQHSIKSSFLVGCDGKTSIIRKKTGISFVGSKYPYRYAMGDFHDNTNFESNATIYIGNDGLVESFPLSGNVRRWVAELPKGISDCSTNQFNEIIQRRTGFRLDQSSNTMFSNFQAEYYLASRFHLGRVLLAGDSAHILSPIGGQGMNLGWMDAWQLGFALHDSLHPKSTPYKILAKWGHKRRGKAKKAIKRAEINMALGQQTQWPKMRTFAVKRLITFPFNKLTAKMFTMRGLD